MKRIFAIILLGVFCQSAAAVEIAGPATKGRFLLLGGKYAEAAEILEPLAKKQPEAAVSLARCYAAEGKLDEAVKVLENVEGKHADVTAELSRLAFERGDYKTARKMVDAALAIDRYQPLARWISAELYRTSGELDKAERGYRDLIRFYNGNVITRAESLRWIGLAAVRYSRWNRLDDQFSFLVNDLYPEALDLEPSYWPARYESALLFLEKYNKPDAADELQAAMELNSNSAEIHTALAMLAMEKRDIEQAEKSIERALTINPKSLDAWHGRVDLKWANFETAEAARLLVEKALPLNPKSEETLGRLGACFILLDGMPTDDKPGRFGKLEARVLKQNPHAGDFYFTVAAMLDSRNKLREAEHFFLKAIERMPKMLGPRSQLALLYMQMGEEKDAKLWLDRAFKVDPFNVRVNNMLEVLEVLDGMETLETEHLIIKYDRKEDALLAEYAGKYLDEAYPRLCMQFGYRPPGKPMIEVFNFAKGTDGHGWFSTRMIGLPYLGTVAACTGKVVAMTSPNDMDSQSDFNWARVCVHELVHIITLQQTDFNIPHWYTEGLAVYSEGYSRPERWDRLLMERVANGELFNLQTINPGFTRPNDGDDWQMAYCQAELYVEFMLSRWGIPGQRRLIDAYAKGLDTAAAMPAALGISQEQFEREYVEYLKTLVADMTGLQEPGEAGFDALLEKHEENPGDTETAAELAYLYIAKGADDEAKKLAEAVLKKKPKHQIATYVMARLAVKDDRAAEAVEMLEACIDYDNPQPVVLNLLAGLELKAEDFGEAARLYSLGQKLDSVNLKWTRSLARVYLLAENDDKLAEVLRQLARADADDIIARKKLADIYLENRKYDLAETWAREGLLIDAKDGDLHRVIGAVAVSKHAYDEAIEHFEIAVEANPDEPHRRFALADACLQAKRPEKARKVLEELLDLVPDYPGAESLLESLDGGAERKKTKLNRIAHKAAETQQTVRSIDYVSSQDKTTDGSPTVTIAEFQDLIRRMYLEKDVARGVDGTFMWLMEEIGELAAALREGTHEEISAEFADVLAWLTTIANVVDVDLSTAVAKKYASGCPGCGLFTCTCPDSEKP